MMSESAVCLFSQEMLKYCCQKKTFKSRVLTTVYSSYPNWGRVASVTHNDNKFNYNNNGNDVEPFQRKTIETEHIE